MAPGINGFLLLDTGLNLMAANDPALQILSFPSDTDRIKQPKVFLADRVRTTLRDQRHQNGSAFVKEFKSGKRRYICKSFRLDYDGCHSGQPVFAVLLERDAAGSVLAEISQQFDRKCQSTHTVDRLNLQPAVRSGFGPTVRLTEGEEFAYRSSLECMPE